jgi:site-specific DNA recombinase
MSTAERNGVLVYIRVSTKDQATSPYNLETQTNQCISVCRVRSLDGAMMKFVDPGESARSMDRPEFQRMLAFARRNKHRFGHLVIQELSRFARNAAGQSEALEELWKLGYVVHSYKEGDIAKTATGKLAANIMGSFNQHFADALSEKMRDTCRAKLQNGRWPFPAPLGYVNVKSCSRTSCQIPRQRDTSYALSNSWRQGSTEFLKF